MHQKLQPIDLFDSVTFRVVDVCEERQTIEFEFGIMSLRSFCQYRHHKGLSWKDHESDILVIMKDLVQIVMDLSEINVFHSDIKPDNIVLYFDKSRNIRVKLVNFDAATTSHKQILGYTHLFFASPNREFGQSCP